MPLIISKNGFTIMELMMVIAIAGILAVLVVPFLYSWQISTDVDSSAEAILSHLRRAQSKALAGVDDSDWGIFFNNQQYTIFKGRIYETRDQTQDEIFEISEDLTVSADFSQGLYFNKNTGLPSATGSLEVRSDTNKNQKIFIYQTGMMEKSNLGQL